MKLLCIGDIIARAGRRAVREVLPRLRDRYKIDYCIANGENVSHGFGITAKCVDELLGSGVDLITSGNHIWDKKEVIALLATRPVLRPLNFPNAAPGNGIWRVEICGVKTAIINLIGFYGMGIVDNPFTVAAQAVETLKAEGVRAIVIDFHAEATSEKNALLKMLEGEASVIYGTHTHIGTDDLLIAKGTGYVSDIGLTGVRSEVIGMQSREPIARYMTGVKESFKVCDSALTIFQAVVFELDDHARVVDAFKIKSFGGEESFVSMRHSGGWQ
ncbi:metallophosphoesterase [Campylobacterota bacterium]|nr:metallophosphoesterase [Campylobacterota bacterium]